MEEKFKYLDMKELGKRTLEYNNDFEIREIVGELLEELTKLGHKKINCKIKEYAKQFLDNRNIEYAYIYYQNSDWKLTYGNKKYFDRSLIINFKNYSGNYGHIDILKGCEDNPIGGYYDNLLKINSWAKKDIIEKYKQEHMQEIQNAKEYFDIYNRKLAELVELRDKMGYLAK